MLPARLQFRQPRSELDEALYHPHVSLIVARFIDRGFGNESAVAETFVVKQCSERLDADGSLPDVLMPVQLRAARGFGVITVPHSNIVQTDGGGGLRDGLLVAFRSDDVIAGDVNVAGIQTDRDRRVVAQQCHEFGDLLKAAAEGEFGTGGVLNQDAKRGGLPRQPVDSRFYGLSCEFQALMTGKALPRAGMENKVFRAESQSALHLATEGSDALPANFI